MFLHVFLALFRGFFNSLFLCAILYLISGCLIHASLVFYMKNNFEFTWETSHPRICEMDVSQFPELVSQTNFLFLFDEGPCNARNVRLYYPYWQYTNFFLFRFCISTLPTLAQWITLVSLLFSLWGRANARNVRLYYPYWQYTNLFIFRFVSEHCLRSTLYVYFIYTLRLSNFRNFLSYSEAEFDLGPVDRCQGSTAIARLNINLVSYMGRNSSHFPGIAPESTGACSFQRIRTRHVEHSFRLTHCG